MNKPELLGLYHPSQQKSLLRLQMLGRKVKYTALEVTQSTLISQPLAQTFPKADPRKTPNGKTFLEHAAARIQPNLPENSNINIYLRKIYFLKRRVL